MAAFRLKFEDGLRARGIEVTHRPGGKTDAILVIGGTRRLLPLWWAKLRRRRIVQRLDGVNWVQRVRRSGLRYTIRAEYGNRLLAYIRNRVADTRLSTRANSSAAGGKIGTVWRACRGMSF